MVEGESGLLSIGPRKERPEYEPSLHRLTWKNGAVATLFSADEPNRLRGPQHDLAWCDELAAWRYPQAWDMLMFGLRLGADPRCVVTTTPRPIKLIRELLADPKVAVTRGRTADNADHLAPAFLDQIVRRYDGTRLGRQELDGELLDDMPGALWTHGLIDAARVATHPDLIRIVVAIDPAASSSETADETGIIVAGRDAAGHGYVLADASNRYAPAEWAKAAVIACRTHHADRIVAEVNNGGEMVEAMLRMTDPNVPFAAVHAAHGKVARDAQHVARRDRMAVEGCAMRDQAEAFAALTGVIDRDARGDLVGARRDVHRPVIGDGGIDRGLDCGGVVMGAVAECAVTPHIEPGMAGAHQQIAIEGSGAGRREGREIPGRLRQCRGQEPGARD